MFTTKYLTAFSDAVKKQSLFYNGEHRGSVASTFEEKMLDRVLQSVFQMIDKYKNCHSASNIICQLIVVLDKLNIPVKSIMCAAASYASDNSETSLLTGSSLWPKTYSLLSSYVKEKYQLLFSNTSGAGFLDQCEAVAIFKMSMFSIKTNEAVEIYINARKLCCSKYIKNYQKEIAGIQDFSKLLKLFSFCSSLVDSMLNFDAEVLSSICLPGNSRSIFIKLVMSYCEILDKELETIMTNFKELGAAVNDVNKSDCSHYGLSNHHVSHDCSYKDLKCIGENITDNILSNAIDQCSVEMILPLMNLCYDVEVAFNCCNDSMNCCCHLSLKSSKEEKTNYLLKFSQIWNWRSIFVPFIDNIIMYMTHTICSDCLMTMNAEWECLQAFGSFESIAITSRSSSHSQSLNSISQLCLSLNKFSVCELVNDKHSMHFRLELLKCIEDRCTDAEDHALKLARHISTHTLPIGNVYLILNSMLKLNCCISEIAIDEIMGRKLLNILDSINIVIRILTDQISAYHMNVISTCLLHDAESNDWLKELDFFENERCSFNIEVWHCHISALKHDLGQLEPSKLVRSVFLEIVQYSIEILVKRYCCFTPSFSQIRHFKNDILAILLYTQVFLVISSSTFSDFLGIGGKNAVKIHSHCKSLITTFVVICCPLKTLYKIAKKDIFNAGRLQHPSTKLQWLSLIQANIWKIGYEETVGKGPWIILHLKLFLQQSLINYKILLKVLLAKDTILAKLVITYPVILSCYTAGVLRSEIEQWDNRQFNFAVSDHQSDMLLLPPSGKDCLKCVLYIFAHISTIPNNFVDLFLQVFGKKYYTSFEDSELESLPLWIEVFIHILDPLMVVLSEIFVVHLFAFIHSNGPILTDILFCVNKELPENLCYEHFVPYHFICDALLEVLNSIPSLLHKIPIPMCHLLAITAQCAVADGMFLPFKVIVCSLNWYFKDLSNKYVKLSCINDNIFKHIKQMLMYICNPASMNDSISPPFQKCQAKTDTSSINVAEIVFSFVTSCQSKLTSISDLGLESSETDILNENLHVLLSTKRGSISLQTIHWFISNHAKWLEKQLCINEELPLKFFDNNSSEAQNECDFNPLKYYMDSGHEGYMFQESIVDQVINKDDLLRDCLPNNIMLSNLLGNRWEFQPDALLDDAQRKYVAFLWQKYFC